MYTIAQTSDCHRRQRPGSGSEQPVLTAIRELAYYYYYYYSSPYEPLTSLANVVILAHRSWKPGTLFEIQDLTDLDTFKRKLNKFLFAHVVRLLNYDHLSSAGHLDVSSKQFASL